MKKILIITGSLGALFILLLLLLPVFLRNNITGIIEKQTARHTDARFHIESIHLSMFKNFPDLHVSIRYITLSGKKEFAGDTLLCIPQLNASVNVTSLLKGKEVVVNRLLLKDARFTPQISATGHSNWDIFLRNSHPSTSAKSSADTSPKKDTGEIRLNDIRIENLSVDYRDETTGTYVRTDRLDLNLSGNLAETQTLLKTNLSAKAISFRQGNLQWLNNTDLQWESEISANFRERLFDLQENTISVNELKLILNGRIGIEKEQYNLDLQLKAPDTRFENLLALLPTPLRKQFDGIQTTGDFTLDATTQGSCYTGHLPRLHAELTIHDASLKYPDLPESINDIQVDLQINNPGGPVDSTRINLQRLTFTTADNPFTMNLQIVNPVNPDLKGSAKGNIDFTHLKKALPFKNTNIEGNLYTDLTFNGKYEHIPDSLPHPGKHGISLSPANLAVRLQTDIKKLLWGQLTAHHVKGNIKLAAETSNGTLNLKTANGNGYITSQNILIDRNPTLQKLASTLKNEELNRISISALKIEFEIQEGNLTVKPFKTTLAGNPATIYGFQSAEGNIAYNLSLNVQRKYFGKDIENILKNIPGSNNIENLDLDIKIEGTLKQPEVKPDLSKALKTIQKEAEKELRKKGRKGLMKELNKLFR